MINHARTLLLNRPGGNQNLRDLGEEYIPDDFVSQSLPPWLASYQRVLFGSSPENIYRNIQIDKLLRVVHATEYESYLTLFDRRLTYDPHASGPFAEVQYGYSFTSSVGKVTEIVPVGVVSADEARGLSRYRWTFTIVDQVASITNITSGATSTIALVSPAAAGKAVSDVITLPGTSFTIRLKISSPYAITDWDDVLDVTLLTRPTKSLADRITELESLREFERNLFGSEVTEPYYTFFGMWRTAKTLPDRLAGILLALVYRLHEIRMN